VFYYIRRLNFSWAARRDSLEAIAASEVSRRRDLLPARETGRASWSAAETCRRRKRPAPVRVCDSTAIADRSTMEAAVKSNPQSRAMPRGGAAGALPYDRKQPVYGAHDPSVPAPSVPRRDPFTCTRAEIADSGRGAALGIFYLGSAVGAVRTTSARSPGRSRTPMRSLQRRHSNMRSLARIGASTRSSATTGEAVSAEPAIHEGSTMSR